MTEKPIEKRRREYKLVSGVNDLATKFPKLASEWHPTKNLLLLPSNVLAGARKKIWWKGNCNHEWEATVSNRTVSGTGCPYCAGKKVLKEFNDLQFLHPKLSQEWHPTKNGKLTPENVTLSSGRKVWWLGKCGHEWETCIDHRTRKNKSDCPFCFGKLTLTGFNDLSTSHPHLSQEWHPTKNGELKPQNLRHGSHKKVWWLGKCGHEWEAYIKHRSLSKSGCPYCMNQKVLKGFNDLETTHPHLLSRWHPTKNLPLTPTGISFGSTRLGGIWWTCENGHVAKALLPDMAKNFNLCGICSNQTIQQGVNDLLTTNPSLGMEWHPTKNLPLLPTEISQGSNRKVWWLGECGHEWKTTVSSRKAGNGCGTCSSSLLISKTEQEVASFIETLGFKIEQSDRKLIYPHELDIYIPELGIAVEYNGLYWHSEATGKSSLYHYNKWSACKEKDIQLIQIWEDDWQNNEELLKSLLLKRLASDQVDIEDFDKAILSKSTARAFGVESIQYLRNKTVITADNCEILDNKLYRHAGFTITKEIPPDYTYLKGKIREPKQNFTIARFRDDPSLKYSKNLTKQGLIELNNLHKIWDAGKTVWEKPLKTI